MNEEPEQNENARVRLRPVRPEDEPFLYALYSSTRKEEIAAFGWNEAQQQVFLDLQFRGQQRHFQAQALEVDYRVIEQDGSPVGQLVVIRSEREIRLADISLLPEYRGGGIGTALIKDLFAEAKEARKPVTLHVEKLNRAARLYERLGFATTGDTGLHFKMEWRAED